MHSGQACAVFARPSLVASASSNVYPPCLRSEVIVRPPNPIWKYVLLSTAVARVPRRRICGGLAVVSSVVSLSGDYGDLYVPRLHETCAAEAREGARRRRHSRPPATRQAHSRRALAQPCVAGD